jgi:hypothetical protein
MQHYVGITGALPLPGRQTMTQNLLSSDDTGSPIHPPGKPSDAIQRFFGRPLFLSLTIGIPFCMFKLLFGLVAVRFGNGSGTLLAPLGWIIIVWAGADFLMNAGRILFDLAGWEAGFEYCTIAQAGRLVRQPLVFLAIDTLLTFSIICTMLWSGWIARLSLPESYLWYTATTLNLISLSLVSLYREIRDEK